MTRFAIIINDTVDNIIVAEDINIAKSVTLEGDVIEINDNDYVDIKDTYTSKTGFVSHKPKPVIEKLTKEERLAKNGITTDNE